MNSHRSVGLRQLFCKTFKSSQGGIVRSSIHARASRLKEEDITLADLAEQVGYQSEVAFSRAFKRFNGISPGAVRRSTEKTE